MSRDPPWPPLAMGGSRRAWLGSLSRHCHLRYSLRRAFLVDLAYMPHIPAEREIP
jgi:hypothetical protein